MYIYIYIYIMKNDVKLSGCPMGGLGIVWRKSLGNIEFKVV